MDILNPVVNSTLRDILCCRAKPWGWDLKFRNRYSWMHDEYLCSRIIRPVTRTICYKACLSEHSSAESLRPIYALIFSFKTLFNGNYFVSLKNLQGRLCTTYILASFSQSSQINLYIKSSSRRTITTEGQ